MDVLSDVLRAVRLTGAVYFHIHARAPWIAETPGAPVISAGLMPEFEHIIAFHVMLEGWAWAQLADESQPPILLEAGDAIIFPRGDAHFLSTERGKRSRPNLEMYKHRKNAPLPYVFLEYGGAGEKANYGCGFLGCDVRPYNPVIDALPRVLHVRRSDAHGSLTFDLMRVALQETATPRAGGETIRAKVSELMFMNAVRQYIDELPEQSTGWLAALRDRHVAAALNAIHARPADPWTLDSLAREVGMSRSTFAERFTAVIGTSAMQYLGNWRLQLAAALLDRPGTRVANVAAEVGYESEAAFNRAFKRQVGVPPGAWRKRARTNSP